MSAEGRAAREDRERSWGYFDWVSAPIGFSPGEDEAKKERRKEKKIQGNGDETGTVASDNGVGRGSCGWRRGILSKLSTYSGWSDDLFI
jgi:hypothetical protein